MAWGQWARRSTHDGGIAAGLDLNAGRARAALGAPEHPPRAVAFQDGVAELPLALNLDAKTIIVGDAALGLRRTAPHSLCAGFLPYLGQPKHWGQRRAQVDAATALAHVVEKIRPHVAQAAGVAVTLPTYLSGKQINLTTAALHGLKIPLVGTCILPLAIAAHSGEARRGTALVLDADDHAMAWSVIAMDQKHVEHLGSLNMSGLGLRGWVDRLMEAVSDRCIRLCRRDPRDSAIAEQSLDEQLAAGLGQPRSGKPWALSIRTEHWFQNLSIAPEDIERACSSFARQVAEGLRQALAECSASAAPEVLWVTAAAARLPGLLGAVGVRLPERTVIEELSAIAPAQAAHALAVRRMRAEIPAGHHDAQLPFEPAANGSTSDRLKTR